MRPIGSKLGRRSAGLLAMVAFLACGAAGVRAATLAELAMLKGSDREAVLVEGAKKKGKVVMYSAMIEDQALRPLKTAFQQKYPFIDAEFWRADSRDLINKTLAEVRSRSVVVDLVEGGGVSQGLIRAGVTQPFSLPVLSSYEKELFDPKGMWAATRLSFFGLAYNTKLVAKSEVPKTYQDLLDPKWKGKLAWAATTETGGAAMFITFIRVLMGEEKGERYLSQLAKQNVVNLAGSPREVVNRVMAGEHSIALNIFLHHPIISAQKGAPVASQPLEPVPANASVMVLVKAAPHPHSALLLMDFLLSRKGQEVIRDADYFPADQAVPAQASLDGVVPKRANLSEQFLSEEVLFANRTKSLALLKKYFQS
jgi:iron(III) transport system substrate-binding protein